MKKIAYALLCFVATNTIAAAAAMPEDAYNADKIRRRTASFDERSRFIDNLPIEVDALRRLVALQRDAAVSLEDITSAAAQVDRALAAVGQVVDMVKGLIDYMAAIDPADIPACLGAKVMGTLTQIDVLGGQSEFSRILLPSRFIGAAQTFSCPGVTSVTLGLTTAPVATFGTMAAIPGIDVSSPEGTSSFLTRLRASALPTAVRNKVVLEESKGLLALAQQSAESSLSTLRKQQAETSQAMQELLEKAQGGN